MAITNVIQRYTVVLKRRLFFCCYVLLIAVFLASASELNASESSSILFQIPSASVPDEPQIAGGILVSGGYHQQNAKFIGQGFVKLNLTERIGVQGFMHHEYSGVGVHVLLKKLADTRSGITHYFGGGSAYSNMKLINSSYPLLNTYLNYTMELPGSKAHVGFGSNAVQNSGVSFLGLEVDLKDGKTFLEFIGNVFNIGLVYELRERMQLLAVFTPNFQNSPEKEAIILTFGIRIVDAFDYVHKSEKEKIIELIEQQQDQQEDTDDFGTQSLSDAIDSIKVSDQYVRNGEFELARDELKAVIEIFPTAKNYSKLGSIYFRLDEFDEAIYHWDKALELDPFNKKLKSFVTNIKGKMGYKVTEEDDDDDATFDFDKQSAEESNDEDSSIDESSREEAFEAEDTTEEANTTTQGNEETDTSTSESNDTTDDGDDDE